MPDQANALLTRMRNDANVDFDNDWKVVTIFIGGNNLCDYCEDVVSLIYSAQQLLHEYDFLLSNVFCRTFTVHLASEPTLSQH